MFTMAPQVNSQFKLGGPNPMKTIVNEIFLIAIISYSKAGNFVCMLGRRKHIVESKKSFMFWISNQR